MKINNKKLLSIYWKGWLEDSKIYKGQIKATTYKDKIEQKAYDLGRNHFYLGDEVSSVDNLTDEEILNLIKDEKNN